MKALEIALFTVFLGGLCCDLRAQSLPSELSRGEVPDKHDHSPTIRFPRDLFDHPNFQTEWWYTTGRLHSKENKEYGFELAFFRENQPAGPPAILADLAISDIHGQRFYFHKSVALEEDPFASIEERPWSIQLGPWQLMQPSSQFGIFHLEAEQDDFGIDLFLQANSAPVLHGDKGLFELDGSDGQGNEFFEYYTIPRLSAAGSITVNNETVPVEGIAWQDHEFFNLAAGQALPGWDWFSIQLEDGSSIMLYGLRLLNGTFDPASRGTFIDRDGMVTHLGPGSFTLKPGRTIFHSNASQADYPISWDIDIPSKRIKLEMSTSLQDQELPVVPGGATPAYWEGLSKFQGTRDGRYIEGKGYLEMTGYSTLPNQ